MTSEVFHHSFDRYPNMLKPSRSFLKLNGLAGLAWLLPEGVIWSLTLSFLFSFRPIMSGNSDGPSIFRLKFHPQQTLLGPHSLHDFFDIDQNFPSKFGVGQFAAF